MFFTLIPQYLNKLVKGEVRNFTTPQPLHAIKIKGFQNDHVKRFAKVGGKFPMKVFTLVRYFSVESCELPNTTPPVARTLDFTRKVFVEFPQCVQGLLQRLWVLYLLTRAKCQVCVFHTEVYPNVLICCRQRFGFLKIRCDIKPIVATGNPSFYRDAFDSSLPRAVFEKGIRHFIKLPLTRSRMPFMKSEYNPIVFYFPTRSAWIGDRLKLISRLDMRSASTFLEKR